MQNESVSLYMVQLKKRKRNNKSFKIIIKSINVLMLLKEKAANKCSIIRSPVIILNVPKIEFCLNMNIHLHKAVLD